MLDAARLWVLYTNGDLDRVEWEVPGLGTERMLPLMTLVLPTFVPKNCPSPRVF